MGGWAAAAHPALSCPLVLPSVHPKAGSGDTVAVNAQQAQQGLAQTLGSLAVLGAGRRLQSPAPGPKGYRAITPVALASDLPCTPLQPTVQWYL